MAIPKCSIIKRTELINPEAQKVTKKMAKEAVKKVKSRRST